MNDSARTARVAVSADGRGLVSRAGAVLLWETMRVTGLARGLSDGLARWRAPRAVHDPGLVTVDLDATIVIAHSEKEQASPTWKKTYGFHPVTAFAGHGVGGNGEPLAIVLRTGSAGSNTAADHIEATRLALAQLPRHLRRRTLIRTDSAGGTHGFLEWLTAPSRRPRYSAGMTITEDMQAAALKVPAGSWTPAYDGEGQARDGAWVADITGLLDLSSWPSGMRVIVRRERPHPGGAAAVHRHRRAPVHRLRRGREERPAR